MGEEEGWAGKVAAAYHADVEKVEDVEVVERE